MAVTHNTTTAEPNDPDYDVSADAWNEAHAVADGSFAAAKLTVSATDRLIGRDSSGSGNGEEIAPSAVRAMLDLEVGTDVLAFMASASQGEMEAGTEAALRAMSPLRVAQAIAALAAGGGGELDYVEQTSPVSITSTNEASPNTVITSSSVAYDGSTVVLIEAYFPRINPSGTASAFMTVLLFEDSTSIGRLGLEGNGANVNVINTYRSAFYSRRITPSAGSHTYSVRAIVSAGTGGFELGAGGASTYMPGYIRITRA